MKYLLLTIVFLSFGAQATCRVQLNTYGLTQSQLQEVKSLLREKNYSIANRRDGSEIDLSVSIEQAVNCIPGLDEIYEVGGGYHIESKALNLHIEKSGRFYRPFFYLRMFSSVKKQLSKIPECRD